MDNENDVYQDTQKTQTSTQTDRQTDSVRVSREKRYRRDDGQCKWGALSSHEILFMTAEPHARTTLRHQRLHTATV